MKCGKQYLDISVYHDARFPAVFEFYGTVAQAKDEARVKMGQYAGQVGLRSEIRSVQLNTVVATVDGREAVK